MVATDYVIEAFNSMSQEDTGKHISQFLDGLNPYLHDLDYLAKNYFNASQLTIHILPLTHQFSVLKLKSYSPNSKTRLLKLQTEKTLKDPPPPRHPNLIEKMKLIPIDNFNIPLSNRFDILASNIPNESETQDFHMTEAQDTVVKNQTPPPIVINLPDNQGKSIENYENDTGLNLTVKLSGEYLKINTNSPEEFRTLQAYFCDNNIPFQTIDAKAQRPVKCVLRGIPIDTPEELILSSIENLGFKPISAKYIKHRITKKPMPLFVLTLHKAPNIDDVPYSGQRD